MNFYASRDFLDAAAPVYFKDRDTAIEDVRFGDDVLRLLVVDGRRIVTNLPFLDYHQPLVAAEIGERVRLGRFAENVVRGAVSCAVWRPDARLREGAPYVDWSGFGAFEDYRALILDRHRGFVRDCERRRRRLAADHGELNFAMNDGGADVFAFARTFKSRHLRNTGHDDFFARPETMAFFNALRERQMLVSSSLRAGGCLVAVWIGFVHDGSWSGWIFTHDPAFRKYAAGHQLLASMLEESFRRRRREFDFSIGDEDYKMVYATHVRQLGPVGRKPLGRMIADAAKDGLRQRAPNLFRTARRLKRMAFMPSGIN
jgi:CelD/BcsL family acetyltransferase involved in cellulose biosynthesis